MALSAPSATALRLGLGMAQMIGATLAFFCLFKTGLSTLSLGFVLGTTTLTAISLFFFRRERRR